MVAWLVCLENRLGFGIESDQALRAEMLDSMVEFRSGGGDDGYLAREGGKVHLVYFLGRNGFFEHPVYLREGAIRAYE